MSQEIAVIGLPGSGVHEIAHSLNQGASETKFVAIDNLLSNPDELDKFSNQIFVTRYAFTNIVQMYLGWKSQKTVNPIELDGWWGDRWTFDVIPGWQELIGQPIFKIVAAQYEVLFRQFVTLFHHSEKTKLLISWEEFYLDNPLFVERANSTFGLDLHPLKLDPAKFPVFPDARLGVLAEVPHIGQLISAEANFRAENKIKTVGQFEIAQPNLQQTVSLDSIQFRATDTFGEILDKSKSALVFSTYSSGLVGTLSFTNQQIQLKFRQFPKAMGIAIRDSRLAVGTANSIETFSDFSEILKNLPEYRNAKPALSLMNKHITGEVAIHEMAFDESDDLWFVNTRFSCLSKVHPSKSFTIEWAPPWISRFADGDRCHLNGVGMREGKPRYVTALSQTDSVRGWRDSKGTSGVIYDIQENRLVAEGLAMPHSPRWYRDRLFFLESGNGGLNEVDLDSGEVRQLAQLPGFTRGLTFIGRYALVGLSQVRDSVFNDLWVTSSKAERSCGIWMVDLESGQIAGYLKFEAGVTEIFEVALLANGSNPEFVERNNVLNSVFLV